MKPLTFFCLFTCVVIIFGCDRDRGVIISPLPIDNVQIHAAEIDKEIYEINMLNDQLERSGEDLEGIAPKYYAVTVLVRSSLGGCRGYEQTRLFRNSNEIEIKDGLIYWEGNFPWTWVSGDTIKLELTESEPIPDGSFDCTDDFYYWHQAIFVGFCKPDEYTIDVNDFRKTFTISESDGTVRINGDT